MGGRLDTMDEYETLVGPEMIERIKHKAEPLQGPHVVNINSTYYGGGVSELLSSVTLLMNSVGIDTGWRIIHGPVVFFSVTKKMHNALQDGDIRLTDMKTGLYEKIVYENSVRNHLDNAFVIVHEP